MLEKEEIPLQDSVGILVVTELGGVVQSAAWGRAGKWGEIRKTWELFAGPEVNWDLH